MQAMAQVKPEETKKYGDLMIALANKMSTDGVTKDELERSLKPIQSRSQGKSPGQRLLARHCSRKQSGKALQTRLGPDAR